MSKPKSDTNKPFKTYPLHLSHEEHARFVKAADKAGKTLLDFFLDAIRKEANRIEGQ